MRIVLACDLNDDNLESLLAEAIRWTVTVSGTLDILFVDPFPYAASHVHDPTAQMLLTAEYDKLRDAQLARLEALSEKIPEENRGTVRRMTGSRPAERVVEVAPSYDLVMVGTHGRTGIVGFFVGSVAERIVRQCPVPTMVLRPPTVAP